jgi:hypothetical protein
MEQLPKPNLSFYTVSFGFKTVAKRKELILVSNGWKVFSPCYWRYSASVGRGILAPIYQ